RGGRVADRRSCNSSGERRLQPDRYRRSERHAPISTLPFCSAQHDSRPSMRSPQICGLPLDARYRRARSLGVGQDRLAHAIIVESPTTGEAAMIVKQIWTANNYRNFNYLIACAETGD